jgi:hypothetical protein
MLYPVHLAWKGFKITVSGDGHWLHNYDDPSNLENIIDEKWMSFAQINDFFFFLLVHSFTLSTKL